MWEDKIPGNNTEHTGLVPLAQRKEFNAILDEEVKVRKLSAKDVIACIGNLYARVYECARGNDDLRGGIVVRASKFNDNECAALVTFLKLQSQWRIPLDWIEDTSRKGEE